MNWTSKEEEEERVVGSSMLVVGIGAGDTAGRDFQILEINIWTRTPIFLDVGPFSIPLSTYVLIKPI